MSTAFDLKNRRGSPLLGRCALNADGSCSNHGRGLHSASTHSPSEASTTNSSQFVPIPLWSIPYHASELNGIRPTNTRFGCPFRISRDSVRFYISRVDDTNRGKSARDIPPKATLKEMVGNVHDEPTSGSLQWLVKESNRPNPIVPLEFFRKQSGPPVIISTN